MNENVLYNLTAHEISLPEARISSINLARFSRYINIVNDIPATVFISYRKHQNVRLVDIFFHVCIQGS